MRRIAMSQQDQKPKSPPDGPGKRGPGQAPTGPTMPQGRMMIFVVVMVLLSVMVMLMIQSGRGESITLEQFYSLYDAGQIDPDTVVISDSAVRAVRLGGPDSSERTTVRIELNATTRETVGRQILHKTGLRAKSQPSSNWPIYLLLGLPILLFAFLIFMFLRGMRGAAGGAGMLGSFGKSRHRVFNKEMTGITFKDVAGIDEAKDEVSEIIEFLKTPKKFTKLGGRIPRGVLLNGPPGCGKTLLAKAIAGEADVPFFSISGSDFVEMFVGVGASRVRDLFKQAKDNAPCLIFLDEIDAVGRRRGGGYSTGGHDEREQTLNAILVEMDGFNATDGVIVIAATNRADVLDPALVRPGRFDRQITVSLPDLKGRLEILSVHAKKVKLGPDVDLEKIARGTPMFSGADLAAIVNEAAIMATMQDKDFVEHEDLEEARDKVKFGRARKSRVREKDENRLVAFHEAGHAVLQALLPDGDPLHKVTIIPRGSAGGATFSLPEKDRMGYGLKWVNATLKVLCGGRIAEARAMGDMSSGASMDIAQATELARTMVTEWGMSEKLGFLRYSGTDSREVFVPDKDYSDHTAELIDQEVRRIVDQAYAQARELLDQHWPKVEAVAEALLKHETLTAEEVHLLIGGGSLNKPTVSDLLLADHGRPRAAPKNSQHDDDGPELAQGMSPSPA
ncbi:MAG: ATP-dependent zinc metalloprotease FtsH [Phycisphaeraceae bacterium]|nr:ATP-dependent zinc metalloprotease FtsH [Phycisphaeraceae bacterium]